MLIVRACARRMNDIILGSCTCVYTCVCVYISPVPRSFTFVSAAVVEPTLTPPCAHSNPVRYVHTYARFLCDYHAFSSPPFFRSKSNEELTPGKVGVCIVHCVTRARSALCGVTAAPAINQFVYPCYGSHLHTDTILHAVRKFFLLTWGTERIFLK